MRFHVRANGSVVRQATDRTAVPAVIAGGIGSTISVVRSLGRAGIPVTVLSAGERSLASASRYCGALVTVGTEPGVVDRWLAWLERDGPRGAVILPSGDEGVELVVRHRERLLALGYRVSESAGDASLAMLDKTRTYQLARQIGVPCPRTWTIDDDASLIAARRELTYPCALKPVHSHLFAKHFPTVKVLRAQNREELDAALAKTRPLGLQMLVTEIIPGPDHATWTLSTYLDEESRPLFALTRNKLRSQPIGFGTNCYLVSRQHPAVAELGLRFLQGVGLRGMAHVEFKWDPRDRQYKLIECNHRFVAVQELLRRAGLDVALLAYQRALGERPAFSGQWREGVRLWFPRRDVQAAVDYRCAGDLTWPAWLRSLAYPGRVYTPVLALDDPMPSVAALWHKVSRRMPATLDHRASRVSGSRPQLR